MRDINIPEFNIPKFAKNKAKYLVIAESIRQAIQTGILQPGELLPSTRKIAEKFQSHRHTVMAALEELVVEGWIVSRPRVAYQVAPKLPDDFNRVEVKPKPANQGKKHQWEICRNVKISTFEGISQYKYNFHNGSPDHRLFPLAEYQMHARNVLEKKMELLTNYSDSRGYLPFVEEIKTYIRRLRAISDREILVTNGAQEAIFIIAQLILQPGDRVAVESPGCLPIMSAFQIAGAQLAPVPVDSEGMNLDYLETVLQKGKIKLIYLTPLHQYPTTVTLTEQRRLRIYELASKYNVIILEDDYDHEFHYLGQPLPPMVSNDPENRILYVSSFSKNLLPSLRLGFIVIPSELLVPFKKMKHVLNIFSNISAQATLALWMQSGGFERHLWRTRQAYHDKRDIVLNCLKNAKNQGLNIDWNSPNGGIAVWINTHQDTSALIEKARLANIAISSEADFQLFKKKSEHIRICYSSLSPNELNDGLSHLLQCF